MVTRIMSNEYEVKGKGLKRESSCLCFAIVSVIFSESSLAGREEGGERRHERARPCGVHRCRGRLRYYSNLCAAVGAAKLSQGQNTSIPLLC